MNTTPQSLIDPSAFDTFAALARELDIPRQTLASAASRGEIASVKLASGWEIVHCQSARDWMKNRPKRGPKPRQAQPQPYLMLTAEEAAARGREHRDAGANVFMGHPDAAGIREWEAKTPDGEVLERWASVG